MIYNRLLKSWLKDENVETYSPSDKRKSEVTERFFRTLSNEIHKYMSAISKNNFSKLAEKYSDTIHSLIKVNPVDVKLNTYIHFDFEFDMDKP